MVWTIVDTQSAKAAIYAVDEYFERTKKERVPVMISATIVDNSGRTLSGQTIEVCFISIKHAKGWLRRGPGDLPHGPLRLCQGRAAQLRGWLRT